MKDIFEQDMAGEPVSIDEPEYYKINEQIIKAQKISADGRMVSVSLLENVRFLRYFPT